MTANRSSPYAMVAGAILIAGALLIFGRCARESRTNGSVESRSDRQVSPTADASESNSPPPASLPSRQQRDQESEAARRVREKLESIIVPVIDFDDTSFEEAIDFLRVRAAEMDPNPDPSLLGSVRIAAGPNADEIGAIRISSFSARNISLWKALKRIASDCHMKIRSTDQGIELSPITSPSVDSK